MSFNISALFFAEFRDHFINHGFHWGEESHMVDTMNMTQLFVVSVHTRNSCDGPVQLHMSTELHPDNHILLEQWAETADFDEGIPERFVLPLDFNVNLPLLDNPPDLLTIWMEMLDRFDDSPLNVNVYASDYMDTPTDPAKRSMTITAQVDIPMNVLFEYVEDQRINEDRHIAENCDELPLMCQIISEMHELCVSLEERMGEWCSAERS